MKVSIEAGSTKPDDLLSVFPSEIGWLGLVGHDKLVRRVTIGHASAAAARKAARQLAALRSRDGQLDEADWYPALRKLLQAYAEGQCVSFHEFSLDIPHRTRFRDNVLAATRRVGYGETTTYGELARQVGHPGAARAVGTAMATNQFSFPAIASWRPAESSAGIPRLRD
jgi:methylated-DNA-[protein]-cysteine S-methyltransferase